MLFLLDFLYLLEKATVLVKSYDGCGVEVTTGNLQNRLVFGVLVLVSHVDLYGVYFVVVVNAYAELMVESKAPSKNTLTVFLRTLEVFVDT